MCYPLEGYSGASASLSDSWLQVPAGQSRVDVGFWPCGCWHVSRDQWGCTDGWEQAGPSSSCTWGLDRASAQGSSKETLRYEKRTHVSCIEASEQAQTQLPGAEPVYRSVLVLCVGICACDLRQAAQSHFLNLVLPEQCEDHESADVPVSLYASQQLRQP